jgi:hypothetical protein
MRNLQSMKYAVAIGLFAASSSLLGAAPQNLAHPSIGAAGTCLVDISTVAYTPALALDGSGGNVLFNGTLASEHACIQQANSQWNTALANGWSPANRCLIIHSTGPSDEILTEITYSWNGGPTYRVDGYGTMCSSHLKVAAPNY